MEIAKLAASRASRLRRAQGRSEDPLSAEDLNLRLCDSASWGKSSDVSEWLARGADPTARDTSGHTALMAAAFHGRLDNVALLLPLSRLDERDGSGNTAADLAARGPDAAAARDIAEAIRSFASSQAERAALDGPSVGPGSARPRRGL